MRKSYKFALGLAWRACAITQPARAQAASYFVSYCETMPATQNEAAALVRAFADASRKDDGNLRFDVMQRIGPSYHFSIVEVWTDAKAQAAHAAGAHTKQFREKLQPLLRSPYDERPHTGLAGGRLQRA